MRRESLIAVGALLTLMFSACSRQPVVTETADTKEEPKEIKVGEVKLPESMEEKLDVVEELVAPEVVEAAEKIVAVSRVEFNDLSELSHGAQAIVEEYPDRIPYEAYGLVQSRLANLQNGVKALEQYLAQFDPKTMEEVDAFKSNYKQTYASVQNMYQDMEDILHGVGVLDAVLN